jgi:hypothetical protein
MRNSRELLPRESSVKIFTPLVIAAALATVVQGCALLATKPLAGPGLQGRLEDNSYTSPQNSFRFRLPWLSSNAVLREEISTADTLLVTIADDLCREFIVSQRPGYLGAQSLESWVEAHIVQDLRRSNLTVQTQALNTRNGPAIMLRYRAPAAAPCSRTTDVQGKKVVAKLDADVGWYVYHRDGRFYRLFYLIGIGRDAPSVWYVKREPVDEVLAQFAEGFEILGKSNDE